MMNYYVQELRYRHRRVHDPLSDQFICAECSHDKLRNIPWPCDAAKLIQEYDRLDREYGYLRAQLE